MLCAKLSLEESSIMTASPNVRIERDSMGEMEVPADALYGASTMRAVLNFPISSLRFPRTFIRAPWSHQAVRGP